MEDMANIKERVLAERRKSIGVASLRRVEDIHGKRNEAGLY